MRQFKTIFLIVGTIIGAGFISGKEIITFFAKYGWYSYIFIPPMFIMFYFLFYKLLLIGSTNKINDINSLNYLIFNKKNKTIKAFSFVSFVILSSTMISAIPTALNFNLFSIESIVTLAFITIIMCIVLRYDISSVTDICTFAVPIILIVLAIVCFCNVSTIHNPIVSNIVLLPYSIVSYVCRNIFLSYFVISKSSYNFTEKQCRQASFWSAFILCGFTTLIITTLLSNTNIFNSSMPLLSLSANTTLLYIAFFVCLLFAILTTLISTLLTLKSFFNFKTKALNILVPILICITLSVIKFDYFISFLYPVIGMFGFYLIFYLVSFNSFFQNTNKNIHQARNNTKNNRTRHN